MAASVDLVRDGVERERRKRLVVRWTDIGIEETVVELDGTALSRAVAEVVTLWPWEPPRDRSPEPPPPPADLPADSSFARSS